MPQLLRSADVDDHPPAELVVSVRQGEVSPSSGPAPSHPLASSRTPPGSLVYGFSRAEFLRMTLRDLRSQEDVPTLDAYLSKPLRAETRLWRHRTKDGTVIEAEVSHHENSLGGHRAWLAVARDVTERLRLERELQRSPPIRSAGLRR